MATHRPLLSLAALLSLLGVTFFYLIVFCQKRGQRKIIPNNSRTLAKKAALRKKKKEEAKKTALSSKSKDGSGLRNRQGRKDDTGIDSEEMSQSDIRTGTGSGTETGTQSEGEPDLQAELSSGEEAKKEK